MGLQLKDRQGDWIMMTRRQFTKSAAAFAATGGMLRENAKDERGNLRVGTKNYLNMKN